MKCCTVSKWRPNNRVLFRVISRFGQNLKCQSNKQTNLSQKNFPMNFDIYEESMNTYIYSAEIKIGNFNSRVILEAKHFFSAWPKMLIDAN